VDDAARVGREERATSSPSCGMPAMSDKFTVKRLQLNVETEELGAAFSPNRTRVLTAVDRTVLLFDVETGHSRKFEHTGPDGALAWSADQRQFLSGAHDTREAAFGYGTYLIPTV
jgi:hypothetical protein